MPAVSGISMANITKFMISANSVTNLQTKIMLIDRDQFSWQELRPLGEGRYLASIRDMFRTRTMVNIVH